MASLPSPHRRCAEADVPGRAATRIQPPAPRSQSSRDPPVGDHGRDTLGVSSGCVCAYLDTIPAPQTESSAAQALEPAWAVLPAHAPLALLPRWAAAPTWGPHTGTLYTPAPGSPSYSASQRRSAHLLQEPLRTPLFLRESSVTDLCSLVRPLTR